ncbi:hypothetical protein SISSUDRAFT_1067422 [Sistotremastrum suecicum HHB10207 ss-3]|uniref:WD40 repeat-like protein n=1 Tax=Sistotremastrum suecicum HHB10207 ss-3 TaxID=1314776 RepID=A0A165X538_9AGAM|nr:hypothetical protein SISSUDRAFT_1067422 [Sistotremastrum suecicum HHB10207 ss-3]
MSTSHVFAPPLRDIVIPSYLTYSSRFWSEHLTAVPFSGEIASFFHTFITQHFLHWLELLGACDAMDRARHAMQALQKWVADRNQALVDFAIDAEKFIIAFGGVVTSSPPHLYISALPFTPANSLVLIYFVPQFRDTLIIQQGRQHKYAALVREWRKVDHTESYDLIFNSLHCNGTDILSVSLDGSVIFWDLETGLVLQKRIFNIAKYRISYHIISQSDMICDISILILEVIVI